MLPGNISTSFRVNQQVYLRASSYNYPSMHVNALHSFSMMRVRFASAIAAVLLILCWGSVMPAKAQSAEDADAHFPWHDWAAEARTSSGAQQQIRCLTGFLASQDRRKSVHEALAGAKALEYQQEHLSSSGVFAIRYDTAGTHAVPAADQNNSGVPDRVELIAESAESAAAFYTNELGYLHPAGNQPLYAIYLRDLGFYGLTSERADGLYTLIDSRFDFVPADGNDAAHPPDGAAQVTVAHELFHAIQHRYNGWNGPSGAVSWLEMDAVTAENQAFPEVNDYLNFLGPESVFRRPSQSTPVAYAHATWLMYFTKAFSPDILRHVWEHISQQPELAYEAALRQEVETRGQTFRQALTELHLWHFASGSGARTDFGFPDASRYPDSFKGTERITLPDEAFSLRSVSPLAANYYMIAPEHPPDSEILSAFFTDAPETGLGLVAYFEDGSTQAQIVAPPEGESAANATPVPALTSTGWNWEDIEKLGLVVINAGFEEAGNRLHQLLVGKSAAAEEDGSIEQLLYGDALQGGAISQADAQAVLEHRSAETYGELGLGGAFAADVSGDGGLTAYDAALIFRRSSGFDEAFPADNNQSGYGPDASAFGPTPSLLHQPEHAGQPVEIHLLLEHEAFYQGEEAELELWVSGLPDDALSAELEFFYPPAKLAFTGPGSGDAQFSEIISRYSEPEPGHIHLSWATNQWSSDGMIGRLRFEPLQEGHAEIIPVSMMINEWAAGDGFTYNLSTAGFEVDPQPPVSTEYARETEETPGKTRLLPNYPNPFNSQTVLAFELAETAVVELEIYNVAGQRVEQLLQGAQRAAGKHEIAWQGRGLSTGIYMIRLTAAEQNSHRIIRGSRKIMLIK